MLLLVRTLRKQPTAMVIQGIHVLTNGRVTSRRMRRDAHKSFPGCSDPDALCH